MNLYTKCLLGNLAALAALYGWLMSQPRYRSYQPTQFDSVATYLFSAGLVGLLWIIAFRNQLEKGRLSILALMLLVTVQAIWLALVRYFGPPWAWR